jgi:multidrug transporter EmrE-like cation transporter
MALPTLAGIVFYSEELTPLKLLCLFLISFSVILGARRGKADRRAYFYYAAIFVLNGLVGVASKIHQSSDLPRVGSVSYMFWVGVMIFLVSGASLIVKDKRLPAPSAVLVVSAGGYGILNGIGNLLLLVALISLPASVQYPLVTGGVMVLSTVISALRREKLSRSELISSAIALAASILIAL